MSFVTLTTDWGLRDQHVAVLKGMLLRKVNDLKSLFFVQDFVAKLTPLAAVATPVGAPTVAQLLALGDEESLLLALDIEPDNPAPPLALAELWISIGREKDALTLLSRMPQTADVALVADKAREKLLAADDGNEVFGDA